MQLKKLIKSHLDDTKETFRKIRGYRPSVFYGWLFLMLAISGLIIFTVARFRAEGYGFWIVIAGLFILLFCFVIQGIVDQKRIIKKKEAREAEEKQYKKVEMRRRMRKAKAIRRKRRIRC